MSVHCDADELVAQARRELEAGRPDVARGLLTDTAAVLLALGDEAGRAKVLQLLAGIDPADRRR